jgi:hypothetical protein
MALGCRSSRSLGTALTTRWPTPPPPIGERLWHDQDVYVELWSEKMAISSIVSPITSAWDVPLMIARGFASDSFLWSTASTIRRQRKPAVIFNLGDLDPSGVAAWRHMQAKLAEFAPDVEIWFERLAVTSSQIAEYDLPTRPTKTTDSPARIATIRRFAYMRLCSAIMIFPRTPASADLGT